MVNPSLDLNNNLSYFDVNAKRVEMAASTSILNVDRDLLISFLTIFDFLNLLYDENTNLAADLSEEFIRDVMLVDFNKVINCLRKYNGNDRRGVKDAQHIMEKALKLLYAAQNALLKQKTDKQVDAFIGCRNELNSAYRQLEHLEEAKDHILNSW